MLNNMKYFLCLIVIIFFFSCSDDENPVSANEDAKPSEPTLKEITIPEALRNKQDPYAQMAVGYMQLANSFKSFSGFFSPPENISMSKTSDERIYTWNMGGVIVTMNYFHDENNRWEILLNGIDGTHVYNDWKYLEGSQDLEGTSGRITCYKEVTTEIDAIWEWEIDEDGIYTMQMIFNNEFDKVILIDNGDLSGLVSHYEFHDNVYVLIEKIAHFTDMSSEYWIYDLEGKLVNHGTWN